MYGCYTWTYLVFIQVQYTAGVLEMAIIDRVQQQHILTEKITMTMEQQFAGKENTWDKRQKLVSLFLRLLIITRMV